jgi:hypothetical protein
VLGGRGARRSAMLGGVLVQGGVQVLVLASSL